MYRSRVPRRRAVRPPPQQLHPLVLGSAPGCPSLRTSRTSPRAASPAPPTLREPPPRGPCLLYSSCQPGPRSGAFTRRSYTSAVRYAAVCGTPSFTRNTFSALLVLPPARRVQWSCEPGGARVHTSVPLCASSARGHALLGVHVGCSRRCEPHETKRHDGEATQRNIVTNRLSPQRCRSQCPQTQVPSQDGARATVRAGFVLN
jgi:hypothetical protein